jgi:aminoglycoside phosphotransferase (APT) family kinase protein
VLPWLIIGRMTWRPEIVVDQALAAGLIHDEFPQLERVEWLGEGWDYTAFRVDQDFVFRFPRREVALPGMGREIATLPRLELPVAVPKPLFVGEPKLGYPWRFYGARYIPGREPLEVTDEVRRRVSLDLARTLRALHTHEAADLTEDANRRADMTRRVPWAREALAEFGVDAEDVLASAEKLTPRPDAGVLCHGDLHIRQLLVGDALNGIIDWVDVCRADPGIDLSLLWSFVPRDMFDMFLSEYGSVAEESLLVARVLALGLNATLANYARHVGNAALARAAIEGVTWAAG